MNNRIVLVLIATIVAIAARAQSSDDKKNAEALRVTVGGSFAKPKIIPKLEKLGIAQATVSYKLTSKESKGGKDRSTGEIAGIEVTAYLETTDGDLTNEDFQEVTDHFYHYFQRQLKANGVDTVAWGTIANTDFYKNADEKTEDNEEQKGGGQVWVTCNANKGNYLYGGTTAFAFGKIKKASRFCDDIDAPAAFFYATVDFADVVLDLKMQTSSPGYIPFGMTGTVTKKKEYYSAVKPAMKVIPDDRHTMFWNSKSQGEGLVLDNVIETDMPYHTSAQKDRSRLKNRAFAFAKAMDPIVIETTRAQYKAAAKKALEKYADAFIAKMKEMKG